MLDIKIIRSVISGLDLTDWTTTRTIIDRISTEYGYNISAREWRDWVMRYNSNFIANGGRRWFIASSNKGYCLTRRSELIKQTANRRRNRLYHEWQKTNQLLKALGEQPNERFDLNG